MSNPFVYNVPIAIANVRMVSLSTIQPIVAKSQLRSLSGNGPFVDHKELKSHIQFLPVCHDFLAAQCVTLVPAYGMYRKVLKVSAFERTRCYHLFLKH